MSKLQPAVKQETVKITIAVSVLTAIMILVMVGLKYLFKDVEILSNINISGVILGGVCAAAITCLNFFMMALTVQKITGMDDKAEAKKEYQKSYYTRLLVQLAWMIFAIVAYKNWGTFNPVAALLPLVFPGFAIKVLGLANGSKADTGTGTPVTEENEAAETAEPENAAAPETQTESGQQ